MRKLLAVMPKQANYNPSFAVTVAPSFDLAKQILLDAERSGEPFNDLDLPVSDEPSFWGFLEWMRDTGRNYPFSISGCGNDARFWRICQKARAQGFHVNT